MVTVDSWLRGVLSAVQRRLGRPHLERIPAGTGGAQVRLELAAETMGDFRRELEQLQLPEVDRPALLQRLRTRACVECPSRKGCLERLQLTERVLEESAAFPCRKPGRMARELEDARRSLRRMERDRRRQEEFRYSMEEQYRFLEGYLRNLADQLPRNAASHPGRYGVKAAVRVRGRENASGDRWAAFPGSAGRYYILLCDGMGVGKDAARDSRKALSLLRQLLTAGYPAVYALRSLNSLLALGNRAGSVTVDLVQLRLDSGLALVCKWGAAPGWLLRGGEPRQIGDPMPPPGLSVTGEREWSARLSLRHGETLILVSDGVSQEDVPTLARRNAQLEPGALAEKLLEGSDGQDDATAVVIRLYSQ